MDKKSVGLAARDEHLVLGTKLCVPNFSDLYSVPSFWPCRYRYLQFGTGKIPNFAFKYQNHTGPVSVQYRTFFGTGSVPVPVPR
ncbi:hypothetical protein HanRHA438_Chr15g0735291 [Helianthus annuus]|nr:hypothetical protein HanRHA438_Chr15g0735291 [Helianthus annuus]